MVSLFQPFGTTICIYILNFLTIEHSEITLSQTITDTIIFISVYLSVYIYVSIYMCLSIHEHLCYMVYVYILICLNMSIYLNIQRDQSKKVYGQIGIRDST